MRRNYTANAFTHNPFYTQTLLHTGALFNQQLKIAFFFLRFGQSNVIFGRKGCDRQLRIVILLQFLTIEPHFVRKGCEGNLKIAILP